MSKIRRALGLMSGTSMDGIDIALIETDGGTHVRRLAAASVPYPEDFRHRLRQALTDARGLADRTLRPGCLAGVERELTERHAEAALGFIAGEGLAAAGIDVIGFHGQTVLHNPKDGITVQLGDGQLLADATRIDVVFDLRAADVQAGGEGAPLAPAYHRALAARLPQRPCVFLNIGGVANVTWIGADESLVAFDTGPGNAMLDDLVMRATGASHDADGRLAASGNIDERVVRVYLMHPYFAKPVPKSLDRNAFAPELVDDLATADAAATLAEFTVEAIVKAREHMPAEPALWIVCGGGRRNRTLMSRLAARVENAVVPAEAVGFDGDTLEAEAWAYLAVRSLDGLALSWPTTTGVSQPTPGGVSARPR
jgi:anhydro-N-acetylmuramic acid kinase